MKKEGGNDSFCLLNHFCFAVVIIIVVNVATRANSQLWKLLPEDCTQADSSSVSTFQDEQEQIEVVINQTVPGMGAPSRGEPSPRGRGGSPPRPALWGGGGSPPRPAP